MTDKEKINKNKNEAINAISTLLDGLISSTSEKDLKKANLISYWLKEYSNYIKFEDNFIPKKQENYKRGDIVKVNLGFNIGNEEGGLHYAIVVNNPDKSSGLINIVPLTSRKNVSKLHYSEVPLGYALVNTIVKKLQELANYLHNSIRIVGMIEDDNKRKSEEKKLLREQSEVQKYINEAKKMKNDESIALVGNITTISKQRVYTPTLKNKFLKGISLSNEQLDLIDEKIKELYTKPKNIM